jgi:hypothetical protein
MIFYRNLRYLPVALKSENLPMGWKEAIYTYPSSIVYEIHGLPAMLKITELIFLVAVRRARGRDVLAMRTTYIN